jgi:two-component system response regulator YesN
MVSVPYDRNRTVWLLQLAEDTNGIGGLQPYVQSNLDAIQSTCRTLLKITVSFVIMTNSCPWPQLPMTFLALRQMMERGLGLGTEIILSGADTEMDQNPLSEGGRWLAQLEHLLDRGELEPFGAICDAMLQASSIRYSRYAEVYLNIAMLLLTKYNRYELDQQVDPSITIEGLLNMDQHFTWYYAAQYLKKMAASIIDQRNQEQEEKSNDIIIKIYQYIQDHLEEDLSLNKLATYVYLNPSYLSRLFKQVTDVSLSEYIAEQRLGKAKYLLNTTDMKVQEVAKSVGLATGYFIRFFKKVTHATPQEYRETFHNK